MAWRLFWNIVNYNQRLITKIIGLRPSTRPPKMGPAKGCMKERYGRLFGSLCKSAILIVTLVLIACPPQSYAGGSGTISAPEIDTLFEALRKGDWERTEKLSSEYIRRDSPAQRYLIARLRYIYIFSVASRIENKTIGYKEIKHKLSLVKGKMVMQPWHPVSATSKSCFNQICTDSERSNYLFTAQANGDATVIYSFEHVRVGGSFDLSSYHGQNARLGGILERIDVNENIKKAEETKSDVTWFLRLEIKDGFIQFER